jgi:hypothetical protein
MRIGDLLLRAKLVTAEQVARALELQIEQGGRLGDNLVAIQAIGREELDTFLHRIPAEPADVAETGMEANELLNLLLKLIYKNRLESLAEFIDAIKLPAHIVVGLVRVAVDRKLIATMGLRNSYNSKDIKYVFTDEGRRWALDALEQVRYAGPAPVTLKVFTEQVNLQKFTNEFVSMERIRACIGDLIFEESIIEQSGPALNSGRAILLYGPSGNGKTSIALRLANVFNDVIYVPYAVTIDGQIIIVYDPSIHVAVNSFTVSEEDSSSLPGENFDSRWVPCKRPFVVTGGELTLDMLDLRYDATSQFYEAPLHMKALGGCFVVDDFGRQLVSPSKLLNRWIVPLESRVDYLKLHTGKSFSIPFDELVIFSTNLEPEELIDPAFLRRLPYKIQIGSPSLEVYKRIFTQECEEQGLALSDEVFDAIVSRITQDKMLELAGFQPRFIIDQVIATCRFMGQPPRLEQRFIEYAIDNLRVKRNAKRQRRRIPVD